MVRYLDPTFRASRRKQRGSFSPGARRRAWAHRSRVALGSWRDDPTTDDDEDSALSRETSASIRLLRGLFLTTVPLPLEKQIQSGYLVAAVLASFAGGGTILLSFVPFLALALSVDASPVWAAGAALFTSLVVDVVRLNLLQVVGLLRPGDGVDSSLLAMVIFAALVGVTYGSDPQTDALEAPASSARDSLQRERQKQGLNPDGSPRVSLPEDIHDWDRKFIIRESKRKRRDLIDSDD